MSKGIVHDIEVDYSRDSLFDELGLIRLKESYMMESESSPQERFAFVSSTFGSNPEHAQRLYEYSSKHWLSYSTPILSFGRSKRGLPISCFLNYIEDSSEGLVDNLSETNWLSMLGGGVGIGFGIRSADDKSTGVMPHLKMYDASSLAFRQGRTRRGSYAAYLDISHPDIISF
jgi:ribonucleoside-diphosphate reductase alpha chain